MTLYSTKKGIKSPFGYFLYFFKVKSIGMCFTDGKYTAKARKFNRMLIHPTFSNTKEFA